MEEEVDILMSSDIVAAQMSTKPITFSRAQSGWLFREDRSVSLSISLVLQQVWFLEISKSVYQFIITASLLSCNLQRNFHGKCGFMQSCEKYKTVQCLPAQKCDVHILSVVSIIKHFSLMVIMLACICLCSSLCFYYICHLCFQI